MIQKRRCPYCKEMKVVQHGKHWVKSKPHWRKKYHCLACKRYFSDYKLLNRGHIRGWDSKVYSKVIKLINQKVFFSNKNDPRKDKSFLSSREIVKRVKKGRTLKGNAVTHKTVLKLIKKHRIEEKTGP